MDDREKNIVRALKALEDDPNVSIRRVAKSFGIPEATLRRRRAGGLDRRSSHAHCRRMSPKQEDILVDWIIDLDKKGFAPNYNTARDMATLVIQKAGDFEPLGQRWLSKFMSRNPNISSIITRSAAERQKYENNIKDIGHFFDNLEQFKIKHNVQPYSIWNVVEHKIETGTFRKDLDESSKFGAPENDFGQRCPINHWVSVVEAINSDGSHLPRPELIFKKGDLIEDLINKNRLCVTSPVGLADQSNFNAWLTDLFIPETLTDANQHRILLISGRCMKPSLEFLWNCRQNNIHVFAMPPCTGRLILPIDNILPPDSDHFLSIQKMCDIEDDNMIKHIKFLDYYLNSRKKHLTPELIKYRWSLVGINPWNKLAGVSAFEAAQRSKRHESPPVLPHSEDGAKTPESHSELVSYGHQVLKTNDIKSGIQKIIKKAGKKIDSLKAELLEKDRELEMLRKKVLGLDMPGIELEIPLLPAPASYDPVASDIEHNSVGTSSVVNKVVNSNNFNGKRPFSFYDDPLQKLGADIASNTLSASKKRK
jgi:hypothetical protein